MGTEKSKGTKVFALGGKINNTGLVEVPMGTTLRTVVEEIGGGIPNGKKFKAAQTGGPSGGCIPAEHFDIPIDYDNLISIGSMMGSGGLIVMDEDDCMVDIAKFFLEFTVEESCGKCTRMPYRYQAHGGNPDQDHKRPEAVMEDLDKLEELCYYVKANSLCGLGQTAPNPVLPPFISSATSTKHISKRNAVRQAYVRHFSPSTLTVINVTDVRCVQELSDGCNHRLCQESACHRPG